MDRKDTISKRVLLAVVWLFALPLIVDVKLQPEPDIRDKLQKVYTSQIGVKEATGNNDGHEVEAYLATTGLGKGYPWCAAFVSWVFEQEGLDRPKTPWTPALFPKVAVIWPDGGRTPQKSDVFGIYFKSIDRIGHAGFIESWGSNFVVSVEGNTNDNGSSEGDGVYRKRRRTKTIHVVADWVEQNQI